MYNKSYLTLRSCDMRGDILNIVHKHIEQSTNNNTNGDKPQAQMMRLKHNNSQTNLSPNRKTMYKPISLSEWLKETPIWIFTLFFLPFPS